MTERLRPSVIVVGAGVFGVTAAIELRRRGHTVELLDTGPVPRPAASSTDISKAVRTDYGSDGFYTDLASRALAGWHEWTSPVSNHPKEELPSPERRSWIVF